MRFTYVTFEDLLKEIKSRLEAEGAYEPESFHEIIDEVVEEFQTQGLLDPDQSLEQLKEKLKLTWPEISSKLAR